MNMFNCDQCNKKYSHKRNLKRHVDEKHFENDNDNDSENSDDKIDGENSDDDENDDHNNENSNKDVNESDKDCENSENSDADDEDDDDSEDGNELEDSSDEEDADDEDEPPVKRIKIDDNYHVWKALDAFIIDPESNSLQKKYINFQKLMKKASEDRVCKAILKTTDHFCSECGLSYAEAFRCTINFLKPIFKQIIKDTHRDDFWGHFLELPFNNLSESNIDPNTVEEYYVNLVMSETHTFLAISNKIDCNEFNKKIIERKNKLMKKHGVSEIDGLKRAVKKHFAQFEKIEENLNNESDVEDDENILGIL